jgi:hypothetical protein
MHHSLLILRAVESKAFLCSDLDNSLAEPTNIAVSKNTPEALYEPVLATIPLYVLPGNKADQRLSNCKTNRPVHTSVHQRKVRCAGSPRAFLGDQNQGETAKHESFE